MYCNESAREQDCVSSAQCCGNQRCLRSLCQPAWGQELSVLDENSGGQRLRTDPVLLLVGLCRRCTLLRWLVVNAEWQRRGLSAAVQIA